MGRKSAATKNGKSLNPTDAYRKSLRKKELKRNKKERQKVREASLLKKDPNQILDQIKKLEKLEEDGKLDKRLKAKKKTITRNSSKSNTKAKRRKCTTA